MKDVLVVERADARVGVGGHHARVRRQRMIAYEDADGLLLEAELDVAIPLDAIGRGDVVFHLAHIVLSRLGEEVEHRDLAGLAVLLTLARLLEQGTLVHEAPELLARVTGRIERARLDERLDHTLVAGLARHAEGEIVQRGERPVLLAFLDDELDYLLAHALESRQAEAHALGNGREITAGLVDVWRQHGDAVLLARVDVVDDLVGLARVAGEHGRHVLVGVMRLEPGRLHGEDAIGGRVRLVERVLGELEDIVPDGLRDLARIAVALGAVEPVVLHGLDRAVGPLLLDLAHEGNLLLGHGLAHLVALARGETAHHDRDAHDLLLVDHGAVGALEHGLEAVVVVGDGLAAQLAVDEVVDHARAQRAGAVQRDDGDDVIVAVRAHLLEQHAHAGRLDLEHAGRTATREQLVHRRVLHVDGVEVYVDAMVGLDVRQRLGDDGERAQAEEVHLEQAHVGGHDAIVLGDDHAALGVELGGDVIVDRVAADDDSRGVDALAAGDALEALGRVDDLGRVRIALVLLAQVGVLCQGTLERHLGVVGNHLGDAGAHVDRVLEHARGVVDGLLGLHLAVGDDVGDALGTVDVAAVLDDVQPALVIEVHVDIGHLGALGRQEALEDEVVCQRVERRDVERVADDGAGGRTATGTDADALLFGPARELLHDEEVRGKALGADDLVFVLEAVDDLLRQRVAIAALEALHGHVAQQRLVGLALLEEGVSRQDDVAELERDVAFVGDFERRGQALRMFPERLGHLLGTLEVELVVRELHAVLVTDELAHADAQHEVLGVGIFLPEVVQVVGTDDLEAHLAGELAQRVVETRLADAVVGHDLGALVLQLDVEVVLAEDVDEGLRPLLGDFVLAAVDGLGDDAGDAGAGRQDAVMILAQRLERDARFVVEALRGGIRDDAHEVAVTAVVLGEQDHVIELGTLVARERGVGREVDLAADDGLDAGLDGRLVELRAAVHVAVIGDGDGGHAELLGPRAQLVDARRAVEQGVLRMHVQVHEGARVTARGGDGAVALARGLDLLECGDVLLGHGYSSPSSAVCSMMESARS